MKGPSANQEDAEIITLAEHRTGAESKFRVFRAPTCFCSFEIDEKTRTVTCKRCGRTWEPFEALLVIARNSERYAMNRHAIRSDVERLKAQRVELKAEIKNLKATKKRTT